MALGVVLGALVVWNGFTVLIRVLEHRQHSSEEANVLVAWGPVADEAEQWLRSQR